MPCWKCLPSHCVHQPTTRCYCILHVATVDKHPPCKTIHPSQEALSEKCCKGINFEHLHISLSASVLFLKEESIPRQVIDIISVLYLFIVHRKKRNFFRIPIPNLSLFLQRLWYKNGKTLCLGYLTLIPGILKGFGMEIILFQDSKMWVQ